MFEIIGISNWNQTTFYSNRLLDIKKMLTFLCFLHAYTTIKILASS